MRSRLVLKGALAALALAAASCGAPATPPAPLDFSAAQREVWTRIPDGAVVGVALGRFDQALDRLRALKHAIERGPVTARRLAPYLEGAAIKLGFDPFDADAWKAHGIAPDSPVGFYIDDNDVGGFFFRPSDAAKARALVAHLGGADCKETNGWLLCGDEKARLADSEARSLWPRVGKDAAARHQLVLFAGLDRFAHKTFAEQPFLAASESVLVGATVTEERVSAVVRYHNPRAGTLAPYFTLAPGTPSLLGALRGAGAIDRLRLSLPALWQLAASLTPAAQLKTITGSIQAATGIDLERDVIDNFTGEILVGAFSSDATSAVMLLGTRDEQRTRALWRSLSALIDGALAGGLGDLARTAAHIERSDETSHGRPVTVYRVDLAKLAAALPMWPAKVEVHVSPGPRGLIIAFGRAARERLLAQWDTPASKVLGDLEPEVRARFAGNGPLAYHRSLGTPRLDTGSKAAFAQTLSLLDADAPALFFEIMQLNDLVYDQTGALDFAPDQITFDMEARLL